jgi:PEP-CTERM motif
MKGDSSMHVGIRTAVVLALVAVGLMVAAPPAQAIIFDLTSDHCTGGCGTVPFGSVELTQNATTVHVTVSLNDSNRFVLTGAADFQEFKFNGAPSLGSITVTQNVAGQTLAAQTGAFNGDGTGNFLFGITCITCGNGGAGALPVGTVLTFDVANSTIAALTVPNNLGNVFVADMLSGTTGNTGPVDASTPRQVPEPATVAFLGTGLVALGVAIRRRVRR